LGFVISWSFILPVQQAHGFRPVAKGNFGATINAPQSRRIPEPGRTLNHMSQELHAPMRASRGSKSWQRLNEQPLRASKAKSDSRHMSRQLRTPMNAILGFIEMVLDETMARFRLI
jgi:signal transduction histidine kinase